MDAPLGPKITVSRSCGECAACRQSDRTATPAQQAFFCVHPAFERWRFIGHRPEPTPCWCPAMAGFPKQPREALVKIAALCASSPDYGIQPAGLHTWESSARYAHQYATEALAAAPALTLHTSDAAPAGASGQAAEAGDAVCTCIHPESHQCL